MEIPEFPNYLVYPDGKVWSNDPKGKKYLRSLETDMDIVV